MSEKTVVIDDGDKSVAVKTVNGSVYDAALKLGLEKDDFKILNLKKGKSKTVALISYTFPVSITAGDKTVKVTTSAASVSEILNLAGIKVDENDLVEPSLTTMITKKTVIDFIDIDYVTEECTEVIPYEVKTVFTSNMASGCSTQTEGSNGLKLVNYTKKLVNGVEVERTVNSERVLTCAVRCIKTVGTGGNNPITTGVAVTSSKYADCYSTLTPSNEIMLDENGVPVNYTKHTTVEATAYTYTGHNMSTGTRPQAGYIAVNPNIIPYGTKMYIVSSDGNWSYGYAVAADTGGFAYSNPYNVDLFFETYAQCITFGRRDIEIYFLPN